MSLTLNCEISLSKKLRKLLGEHGTVTLTTGDLVNGRGEGRLSLDSEYLKGMSQFDASLLGNETSITLTPVSAGEEMPTGSATAALFSNVPVPGQEEPLIQRMAAVNAPAPGQVARAIAPAASVPAQMPTEIQNPAYQSYVADLEGLIEVVNLAKNKVSDISLQGITDPRELAIQMEAKEQAEAIDVPAYIVNDKCATLTVNDLDIALSLNMPYDLSKISAKRIAASTELRSLLTSKFVKFISPAEVPAYVAKATGETQHYDVGLEVYDNHEQAEASMASTGGTVLIDDATAMDISADDNGATEEQSLINLTKISEVRAPVAAPEGTRVSVHGSPQPAPAAQPVRAPSGVSTIRRAT